MTGCEELIAAFTIFGKYTDTKWPTHCEHDVMQVGVEYDSVSDEDKKALEALGFIDRVAHVVNHAVAHPADGTRQPCARVNDEAVNAVIAKVEQLARDFFFGQVVVPEPEGRLRKLAGGRLPLR